MNDTPRPSVDERRSAPAGRAALLAGALATAALVSASVQPLRAVGLLAVGGLGLLAVPVVARGGPGQPAERQLWTTLARAAAVVTLGLLLEGVVGLLPIDRVSGAAAAAGSVAGSLIVYQALIRWNRYRSSSADPGDWLNGLSAAALIVSIGLLVVDVADLPMGEWSSWRTATWLTQLALGVVVWGTSMTLVSLGGLKRDSRLWSIVVALGLLIVLTGAAAAGGAEVATAGNVLGWSLVLGALAVTATRRTWTTRPKLATPHATTIGAMVVFVIGAVVLATLALVQPEDVLGATLLAVVATAAAATRLLKVVEDLDALARSRFEARTDDLTGIANRRGLMRTLGLALDAAPPPHSLSLLVVDLDRFKDVNDRFGHAVGDDVLRVMVGRMTSTLGSAAVLARLGGDEFAAVLTDHSAERCVAAAVELEQLVREPVDFEGRHMRLGCSIGIVHADLGEEVEADELMRRADAAMYTAKRSGGGVAVYDREADRAARDVTDRVEQLGRALSGPAEGDGRFVVHYQPQVDATTGGLVGCEALVRWDHPVHGLLAPAAFIDLVEHHGMMPQLTELVLEQAVRDAAGWERDGSSTRVSVNLSASSLASTDIAAVVDDVLHRMGLTPSLLVLEITETVLMDGILAAPRVLHELADRGIRLSVDDFGTGYSSLAYLADLPVTELKIDRSFVSRMLDDSRTRQVVAGTIDLAHRLELTVVAEGVEDGPTLGLLRAMRCDVSQGFLHARPVPHEQVRDWHTGSAERD